MTDQTKTAAATVLCTIAFLLVVRNCACSRTETPQLPDDTRSWLLASTGGWFACPACGEKVTLTEEQRKLGRPPEMKCPHCGKPIEWEKIGTAAAAPPKMPAPKSQLPTYDFDAK